MLRFTLQGARGRWVTFTGSFVALALGVGLIAATGLALAATFQAPHRGPERFAGAPVVVRASDTLRVSTPNGERTQRLAGPSAVPDRLAAELARLGRTVEDRTFPVSFAGAASLGSGTDRTDDKDGNDGNDSGDGGNDTSGGVVGHPWSVAAATPYRLTEGRAPAAPGEITVAVAPPARDVPRGPHRSQGRVAVGDRLRVVTPAGIGTRTVVGTVAATDFEKAVFFTEAEAAQLSPRIDALVVHADPADVREAVRGAVTAGGIGFDVLTGDARRRADPDPDRDSEALVAVNALLGTAAGITCFVSVFVVASTFAFAVAQRRREFGLLRTAGATPRQIRRTVLTEAVLVAVPASAAGCLLGAAGAPPLAAWMVRGGIAPAWFAIGDQTWPLHTAFWTGLCVALAGVVTSSWRAGRIKPTEALREAAVDSEAMPVSRRLLGALVLLVGLGLLGWSLATDPGEALKRKTYITRPMVLIVGFALYAPVLVPPLIRLVTWLPARLPGATGLLARENAATGVRRTAAIAAPVLITVALAASLLGTTATIGAAKAAEATTQTRADYVATAQDERGALPAPFVERARNIPGIVVSASRSTTVTALEEDVALVESAARAVEPAALTAVSRLPVASGRPADLDDGGIVVNEEWRTRTVGQRVRVWLGDGREATLRIVAVLRTGTGDNGAYVTPRNAPGAPVDRVDVRLRAGADAAAVDTALREAGRATGTTVLTREEWTARNQPRSSGSTRLGMLLILGIALLYTGIALANTLIMSVSDRVGELALLRLAGATKPQVLRLVAAEALVVVAVGSLLGAAVAALNLLGLRGALALLSVPAPLVVPWGGLGLMVAASAVLAVVAAVVPALTALRTRPVEFAGTRE
ncbi:FtsX-like permease family protein [Streptomyces sp. NBC_01498]|uniref:ABC transporter permease n=1 Tax=Streptomyces sp. NBC_01498 TaxID=2975870 RepID=UPI002E7B10D8|nr:FtsX-like permease family protein [Streptomyces sp. NBC_01498]WTL24303.1 FtsX-like permease family protein [Streptomyces sp. NBC_01498]